MPTSYDNLQPSLALTQTIVTSGAFLGPDSGTGAGIAFVRNFAGNFGMQAQPLAHGQLLSIAQNTALFSLIGTYYGGNGTTNFALPNLDGRVAVGTGVGPGLTERVQGEQFGQDTVYFGQSNLLPSSGGTSAAFDNDQPSLAMHYMIQVLGVFPSDSGGYPSVGNQLIGDVALFAGNFSPSGGWMDCDGRLLPIAEYEALFVLIGTTYGGDGQTTFALPDLRGRAIVGAGQGGGLPNRVLGEVIGSETGQLTLPQMPGDMGGSSAPVQDSQPSLALNYMIALQGIYPSYDSGGGYEDNSAVYIGEVMATALNFAPGGFAFCQGQLLSIQQNQALFSLLGTMYGGNGITTFALPDLRGRSIIGTDANHLAGERFGTSSFNVTSIDAPLVINDDDIAHNLYGGEAGDTINGNGGADRLQGNGGADRLNGGIDADTMIGGTGDDTYVVDTVGDVVTELPGEGIDTVLSAIKYVLGAEVENLILTGSSNLNGNGNGLDNVLQGNGHNNNLKGLGGNDYIDGGLGVDSLFGGLGDDSFVVDNVSDFVGENAGEGIDVVLSSVTFTLGANVEKLTLTGSFNADGTGNALANTIVGNGGNNRLDGKGGADTMTGGLGNDTYVIDSAGDIATELSGEGVDTIETTLSYVLGATFENLTLTGTLDRNGNGNALDNVMKGNAGINILRGLGGNDVIDGGAAADRMYGGTGDDTFVVDNAGDLVIENVGEGTDTIQTTLSYVLGATIENLTLIGGLNRNGNGNALGNALTGNSGNNNLKGLDGTDKLEGKAGSDVLYGGLDGDTFVFNFSDSAAAATTDSVMDLNFAQSDVLNFVGFGGIVPTITSYHDLAAFVTQAGASVVAGPTAGVAQLTLMGANGHTQTINLTDTSGNGTAMQQYQAAAGSLTLLSTGLPMGDALTYYARFVDEDGGVIPSDGNNGWVALQSFSEGQGIAFLAFGTDLAATRLYACMLHGTPVGVEVEAYQTVGGQLQLVDQYLFEQNTLTSSSGGTSQQAFSLKVGQIEHDHWARNAKGVLQAPTEFGWDYNNKTTVNLGERANFITDGKSAGGRDQDLHYVVRVFDAEGTVIPSEGSNGWMSFSGLSLNVLEGKAEFASLLLNSGNASVALSNALQGDRSMGIEVEAYKATANGVVTVDEYLFSNVHVTDNTSSAFDGGTPQDGVSFRYDAFQQTHNTLDANNKVTATGQSGWNFVTKADAVISDVGDFTASDTTGAAEAARILVGRFVDSKGVVIASEGTNGWVAVSSMGFSADDSNYHPPVGQSPVPLFVNVDITGSDKLAVALENAQLAGAKVSFQVESLALIGGQYTQVDEYLFSGASIIASVGVEGFTDFSASVDAFTHSYAAHDTKGAVTSTSATGWNFVTKAQAILPDTVDFQTSDHTTSHDENLTYVVRFLDSGGKLIASDAGSSGWIATTSVLSLSNGTAQLSLSVTDDAARLALTTAMLNGSTVRADVEAYRTTASGLQLVDDYLFGNVAVDAVSTSDSGQTALSLTPLQYTHRHNVYDAKGVATQSTTGWDFKANSATTLSDVGNYATGGVPVVSVDQPTHLTYYARFLDAKGTPLSSDGSGGWVALSAFGETVNNYGGSKAGEVVVNFGDDRLFQALNLANLTGTTSLTLEVDGFAGTQLVDQNLFAQINIRQLADPNGGVNPFYIDFQQTQSTHYINSKASVSQGWYLGTGAVPAPLTSAGAYNPAIPAGGGAADHVTYYMKLLDNNGQTILTDGGHSFSEISGLFPSLASGQPYSYLGITLGSDQTLLTTFQALVLGQTLSQIEIEAYVDSPTGPRLIDEYLFNGATPSIQYEAGAPSSTLTFTFTEFQQAHLYSSGKGYATSLMGWDFALDHAVSSFVTPHADLFS